MSIATRAFAIVRPRVVVKRTSEAGLLEDIVAEIADEYGSGFVRLTGGPGTGKSTALAHLAAAFSYDERFVFLDEPTLEQLEDCPSDLFTIAATPYGDGRNMELVLQPWGMDELIEYLLAVHHDDCGSVISRLGAAAKTSWCPQLACIVMDQLAADYELNDASDALVIHMHSLMGTAKLRQAVAEFCIATFVGGSETVVKANDKLVKAGCTTEVRALLRHKLVQFPLAAARIIDLVVKGYLTELEKPLPFELIELVGWQCGANASALDQLKKALALQRAEAAHAMMASSADITAAILRKADLSQANLAGSIVNNADLSEANLTQANLSNVDLRTACLNGACLERAILRAAQLEDIQLVHARLREANLRSARLTGSALPAADLRGADLRGAELAEIDWEEADLRGANLTNASFHMGSSRSGLVNSPYACEGSKTGFYTDDLEDLSFKRPEEVRKANLRGADLRDVRAERVDFYLVDLRGAKMEPELREQARASGAILDDR